MRFFVGILVLAVVGSTSATILGGLINSLINRGSPGLSTNGWDINRKVGQGGDVLSIPGDVLRATKILLRSIWKIMTGRVLEGIRDMLRNGYDVMKNIFRDVIGEAHGIDPSLQDCLGELGYNPALKIWECYSSNGGLVGRSGSTNGGSNHKNRGLVNQMKRAQSLRTKEANHKPYVVVGDKA